MFNANNDVLIRAIESSSKSINTFEIDRFPDTPEEEEEEVVEQVEFEELLSKIDTSILSYEESKDILYLKEAIETFGSLPKYTKEITNALVSSSKELDDYFKKIRNYCYSLDTTKNQETYVKMFAEKIFLGWKYDKEITHYKDVFLLNGLVYYNTNKLENIQERLNYLDYVAKYYLMYGDPYPKFEVIPDIMLPPEEKPPIIENKPDTGETNNNGSNNGSNNTTNDSNSDTNKPSLDIPVVDNSSNFTYITNFKKEGKECYKIEETYQDGKKIKENKTLANKSDYVQCSIYDYVNFGAINVSPDIQIDKDYLYNNQNADSEYFAYYTITKKDKNPYYYNTGIRASLDGETLSYNQLSDLLYQITIKIDSFNVKSNNKSLFVIDGEPIVLDKITTPDYKKDYVENLFENNSNIGIKIMKNSSYKNMLLENKEEKLTRKYINNITIDGDNISDKNIVWLNEDGIIKIDIKAIAELLGAKVHISNDILSIEKDDVKISIKNNNIEYTINDETSGFLEKVYISDDKYVCELANIPQHLGFDVDFDIEKFKLEFNKIK